MVQEIKLCPNCGNPDIDYASLEQRSGAIIGIGIPEQYYCPRCGYFGSIVVEVPMDELKKVEFHPIKKAIRVRSEKSSAILEPVFVTTLLIFFTVAFFFILPKYNILNIQPAGFVNLSEMGSTGSNVMIISTSFQENATTFGPLGITYIVASNTSVIDIDRALGLQNVSGFLVPLFFLFLIVGMLILAVDSHWHRVRFFS